MANMVPPPNSVTSVQTLFHLEKIAVTDASTIDRIKLVGTKKSIALLYSIREADSSRRSAVTIHAITPADPAKITGVRKISMLLSARISWDARSKDGDSYEIVYQEAGGAVNSLIFSSATGDTLGFTTHYPFQSFSHPHFIRSSFWKVDPAIAATVDKKKIVIFKCVSILQEPTYDYLAEGYQGIVGGEDKPWVVVKHSHSGNALLDVMPGRLSLIPSQTLTKMGAAVQELPFPDRDVYEFDAASLSDDVLVFATGKPSVLLLGSRRAHPIQLSAKERSWLSRLSSPTIYVDKTTVHIAGLMNPGSKTAAVLYGAFLITDLLKR